MGVHERSIRQRVTRRGALALAVATIASFAMTTGGPVAAHAAPVAANGPGVHGPYVRPQVTPARFDGHVRSLPPIDPASMRGIGPRAEDGSAAHARASTDTTDAGTMQTSTSGVGGTNVGTVPSTFATPSVNFEGINSNVTPPDDNGAIGPRNYVQMVNFGFQVFDRQGTDLSGGVKAINSMWTGAPASVCRDNPRGDPYVVYDHLADRWLLGQLAFAVKTNPWDVCLAVSQTSDPTGSWFLYDVPVGATADYPKIGMWPTAYALATQEGYKGGKLDVFALDRSNMLNGNPLVPQQFKVDGPANVLIPADLSGPLPPAGADPMLVRAMDGGIYGGGDRVEVWNLHPDWGVPANSSLSLGSTIPVADFDSNSCLGDGLNANCVPQPGVTDVLDAGMVWTRSGIQYRNFADHQAIVLNHTVNVGSSVTGIRWEELRAPEVSSSFTLYQQGTFNPQTTTDITKQTWRWMGSTAMDAAGDIALGYNVSNADALNPIYPGIRYTGRLATDPLGELPQGEQTIVAGTSTWNGQRWGDYSMMRVDPVDGCTFWYTNEYVRTVASTATQGTRVAAFRFPTCNPADLAVTQSASPGTAVSGTELDYSAVVTNNGPSTATNVTFTDALDPALSVISTTPSCTVASGNVSCPLGTMASGSSRSVLVRALVPEGYNRLNGALASLSATAGVSATELDPVSANDTATTVTSVRDSADLQTNKLCDSSVGAGNPGSCTIYVDNHGPSDVRALSVSDHLTSGGSFTVTGATIDNGGSCAFSNTATSDTTVSCTAPALVAVAPAAASRAVVQITFSGNEAQTVQDTATASAATPDPDASNNTASQSVPITARADLSVVSVSATPSPVLAGNVLTVTTSIVNNGPSTAQNVLLTNAYPVGTSVVGITAPSAGTCQTGTAGDALLPASCPFGGLASGGTRTMTVTYRLASSYAPPGPVHIDAAVSSATFDPDNSGNTAHSDTPVGASADLGLLLTGPAKYKPSTTLSYVLTVSNAGPSDARSVRVVQNLPVLSVGHYVSNSLPQGSCTIPSASNALTCDLGPLASGAARTYSVQYFVQGNGKTITTTATVGAATDDPSPSNNSRSLSISPR